MVPKRGENEVTHSSNVPEIDNEGTRPWFYGHEFTGLVHDFKTAHVLIVLKHGKEPRVGMYLDAGRAYGLRREVVFVDPELARPVLKRKGG